MYWKLVYKKINQQMVMSNSIPIDMMEHNCVRLLLYLTSIMLISCFNDKLLLKKRMASGVLCYFCS